MAVQAEPGSVEDRARGWDDVLLAVRRLDRAPLRRLLAGVLADVSPHVSGQSASPAGGVDALLLWRMLGQALSPGSSAALDAAVRSYESGGASALLRPAPRADGPGQPLGWDRRAAAAVDFLLDLVPSDRDDASAYELLVLGFCYVECLVFWEHSSEHAPIRAILDAVERRAIERSAGLGDAPVALALEGLSVAAASVQEQFDVEVGWTCGCPVKLTAASGRATATLRRANELFRRADVATVRDPFLGGALRVLAETVDDALLYFDLLSAHVGPAASAFVANLDDRLDDEMVSRRLADAREAVHGLVEGRDPRIKGVFQSEARAQGRVLDGMRDVLATGVGGAPAPSLVVQRGEIHYLYPFSLPVRGSGSSLGDATDLRSTGSLELVGCPVVVEEALRTDALSKAAVTIAGGDGAGARLVFADHHLVLESAAGVRYVGLDIEVVLGPLGNHLLRITATTETSVLACSEGADHECAPSCAGSFSPVRAGWTPHDLDQLLHRGGMDFGEERVYLAGDAASTRHDAPTTAVWPSLIELAAAIVDDLHALPGARSEGIASSGSTAQLLRQQEHVLLVVVDAVAVADGRAERINTAAALAATCGSEPLFSNQPTLPRAPEEWTCAASPPAGLDEGGGLASSMDALIRCNGDTTLLFAPFSPNWQMMEDRELVTFALSLGSAYAVARAGLLRCMEANAVAESADELAHLSRRELAAMADAARRAEGELNRWVTFADALLDHARGAVVIRPRRDRLLLDHVTDRSGVADLQSAMSSTRAAAGERLLDLRAWSGRIADAQRRRGETWIERALLALAVLALIDVMWWFYDVQRDEYAWDWTVYFWLCVSVLAAIGLAVGVLVFRAGPPGGQPPGAAGSGDTDR